MKMASILKDLMNFQEVHKKRYNLQGAMVFYGSPRSLSLMCKDCYSLDMYAPMDPMAHGVILHFLAIYGKCFDSYLEPSLLYLGFNHLVSALVLKQ